MVRWAGWMLRWAGWAKGQSPPGGAEAACAYRDRHPVVDRSQALEGLAPNTKRNGPMVPSTARIGAARKKSAGRRSLYRRSCLIGRANVARSPGGSQGIGAWLRIEDRPLVPRTGIFLSDQNPFVVPGSGPSAGPPVPLACATPRWGCLRRLPAGGGPRRC
jgi:hypothetical protein